jgi:hypothetical protein
MCLAYRFASRLLWGEVDAYQLHRAHALKLHDFGQARANQQLLVL